jgi:hypothetical protein
MRGPSSINRPIHMELCRIQLLLTYGMALWACWVASQSTPPSLPILAATLKINCEKTWWSQLPIKHVIFSVALHKFRRGIPWHGTKHYSTHETLVLAYRRATTLQSMRFFFGQHTLIHELCVYIQMHSYLWQKKKPECSKLKPRLSTPRRPQGRHGRPPTPLAKTSSRLCSPPRHCRSCRPEDWAAAGITNSSSGTLASSVCAHDRLILCSPLPDDSDTT